MHQYLFYIGDFPIRAYGLLLSLGIFCAAAVAYYLFKRDGRDWHVHMFDFAIQPVSPVLSVRACGTYSFSIGNITNIISWKFRLYGKAVWLYKAVLCSAP